MATVLFCEDDPVIRKLIEVALRNSGHEILIAPDGAAGLEWARRERPAAVFTDLEMPKLNGLDLCDAIRADPELCDIPVVVLTASAQRSQIDEARGRGATDVLLKPFSVGDLRAMVQKHLQAG